MKNEQDEDLVKEDIKPITQTELIVALCGITILLGIAFYGLYELCLDLPQQIVEHADKDFGYRNYPPPIDTFNKD